MFTGLVADIGRITRITAGSSVAPPTGAVGLSSAPSATRLTIAPATLLRGQPVDTDAGPAPSLQIDRIVLGESVAIDGTCLTVVAFDGETLSFEVGPETLARTTLGRLRVGDAVNLERAMRLSDRLGGHLVTGHIDGVGTLVARKERGPALDLTVEAGPEVGRYLLSKGAITVDGVSLTVNAVTDDGEMRNTRFEVSLIPHTRAHTTLESKPVGAPVNLEADLVGKYIERLAALQTLESRKS